MEQRNYKKPLGRKNYGSIPHLKGSRLGPGEHHINDGQMRMLTENKKQKNDKVIVQEKLDGSNVGITKINGELVALSRAGYLANTSPFEFHHMFSRWVDSNKKRFGFLKEGQRVCGEWLALAHGTIYKLPHEPFVAFDIMYGKERLSYEMFKNQIGDRFVTPRLLNTDYNPMSIEDAILELDRDTSFHGAQEEPEGAVWRYERGEKVYFLAKYVRPSKVDGKYLFNTNGSEKKPKDENDLIYLWSEEDETN